MFTRENSLGEKNVNAKLTKRIVLKIRMIERYSLSVKQIAKKYGVSQSCIRHILLGNTWIHI